FLGPKLEDGTLALTAIAFDHTGVRSAGASINGPEDAFPAAVSAVKALSVEGLRHLFVLATGFYANDTDLVRGFTSVLPEGVTVSGGFAACNGKMSGSSVWLDSNPNEHGVVALGFYGSRLRIARGVGDGWTPFGPERLVTKAEGRTIYEFDGR